MTVVFDHLIAVVAGVVLLGSLFVIQTRDRLTRVEATLADATVRPSTLGAVRQAARANSW